MDDTTPHATSWPTEVAVAALTGVVTARFPVQRWSRPARWGMHGGIGALTGGAMAVGLRHGSDTPEGRPGAALTAGLAAVTAVAMTGLSRGGEAADGWMEQRLRTRGVRRPRLWMGVAAAGASLAMSAADRRRQARDANAGQISPGSVGGGGVPGSGGVPGAGG